MASISPATRVIYLNHKYVSAIREYNYICEVRGLDATDLLGQLIEEWVGDNGELGYEDPYA